MESSLKKTSRSGKQGMEATLLCLLREANEFWWIGDVKEENN